MKNKYLFSLAFVLGMFNMSGQFVETLASHPKIKDGMYVDDLGNVYTTSGGWQGSTRIGQYNVSTSSYTPNFLDGFLGPIDIDELSNGDFVVTNFDDNTVSSVNLDSEVITQIADGLDGPAGIAIDDSDNIYISNFGAPDDYTGHQIHKISSDGTVSVLADSPLLYRFQAIVFNGEGELIVSSLGRLLKVNTVTGEIEIWQDFGSTGFGNMVYRELDDCIYATASSEGRIYKVDALGVLSVFAGSVPGYQNGMLSQALFNNPHGIELSPDEEFLYVGDSNTLRRITFAINVGLEENVLSGLDVYPNPSSSGVFTLENESRATLQIKLLDASGKEIHSQETSAAIVPFDISEASNGTYYLKIESEAKSILKKILKN